MQYEKDSSSPLAPLFFHVRACILKNAEIREVKKANITSYFCKEGGICYLRTKGERLVIGLFQGICLESLYDLPPEKAKQIRHLYFTKIEEIDEAYLQNIISDSIICAVQRQEENAIRRQLQRKKSDPMP